MMRRYKLYLLTFLFILVIVSCGKTITSTSTLSHTQGFENTGIKQNTELSTVTPKISSITPKRTIIPSSPVSSSIPIPTLTDIPGKIITDPNKDCQKVPTPALNSNIEDSILLSGTFSLCEQWPIGKTIPNDQALWGFDFDSGKASGIYNNLNDILYFIIINKEQGTPIYWITSTNNSHIYSINADEPTYNDCLNLINSSTHGDGSIDAPGAHLCIVTNDGHIAFMKVNSINQYGWGSLSADFITWEKR